MSLAASQSPAFAYVVALVWRVGKLLSFFLWASFSFNQYFFWKTLLFVCYVSIWKNHNFVVFYLQHDSMTLVVRMGLKLSIFFAFYYILAKTNHNSFHEFSDKTIKTGKLQIDVKYFFFSVHSETRDICGETTCPATGNFVLSHGQTLPSFTPPGSYTITMKMLGDNNEELSCISFGFSIGWVASSWMDASEASTGNTQWM